MSETTELPLTVRGENIKIGEEEGEKRILVWILNMLSLKYLLRTQSGIVKQVVICTHLELMGDTQVLDKK